MRKVVSVPVLIKEYKVRQISQDGFTVEGTFSAAIKGIPDLGHIQNTWMVNQPMFINSAEEVLALVTEVSQQLPVYLTSPDPSHRALAQLLVKLKGSSEKESR